jgi:predicted nucleic acid-binding protein
MKGILVDSNVILDVFTKDSIWATWSKEILGQYKTTHNLLINSIIYAEISVRFESVEELEGARKIGGFQLRQIPKETLFLAGKVFVAYRKRGGIRRSPLPDFFIGAHAAIEKLPLLTRDANRYQTDFPTVELISPEETKV